MEEMKKTKEKNTSILEKDDSTSLFDGNNTAIIREHSIVRERIARTVKKKQIF